MDRRTVAVKIDNHPRAIPQSGLDQAEIVYEVVVEGGLTRFLALYHITDTDYLGPMRSGRPTDAHLLEPLGGTFVISGASHWVLRYFNAMEMNRLGEGSSSAFRISSRRAPHNLYVDTTLIREGADRHSHPDDPPPVLFDFGAMSDMAREVTSVRTQFTTHVGSTWVWNGEQYERHDRNGPQVLLDADGNELPFVFDGVVVLRVVQYTARPPSPADGTPVPASETVGSGEALIFADGRLLEGTWERHDDSEVIRLLDVNGETIIVPAGRYWIALVPTSGSVDFE